MSMRFQGKHKKDLNNIQQTVFPKEICNCHSIASTWRFLNLEWHGIEKEIWILRVSFSGIFGEKTVGATTKLKEK